MKKAFGKCGTKEEGRKGRKKRDKNLSAFHHL